ncbi:MAG: hypothetical protein NC321_14790 [Clostridium sp.]|nr:hypothetical protein [Clostridium sp.]
MINIIQEKNKIQTKYIKQNMTKDWLLSNGFYYNKMFSDNTEEVYTYKFPVYKYNKLTVLECELRVILGEDVVNINVYDYNTHDKYAPFYYCEYGNYDKMLEVINHRIEKELNKSKIIKE